MAPPAAGFDFGAISILPPQPRIGAAGGTLESASADRIRTKQGTGAPLDTPVQERMEGAFGHPFSDVRVHDDSESDQLNRGIGARAFTFGSDIFLGGEAARAGAHGGDHLLAHELTHVVQQRGAPQNGPLTVAPADAPGEREASAVADAVGTQNAGLSRMQPASQSHGALQRDATAAPDAPAAPTAPGKPADIAAQSAFNPMDINHKLLRAIDQKQIQMGVYGDYRTYRRHVEFNDTVAALNGLTADQIKKVNEAYSAHEDGRTLQDDLFGGGESGYPTDLTADQILQLGAMLGGTQAGPRASEQEKHDAEMNAASARAAELHGLLHGSIGKDEVEHIMTLLRQDAKANATLSAAYGSLGNGLFGGDLHHDLYGLGAYSPLEMNRAMKLLDGDIVGADAYKVHTEQLRIQGIDERLAKIRDDLQDRPSYDEIVNGPQEIKELLKERKELAEDIEKRGEQAAADAIATAPPGTDPQAAVKARVGAVFGDTNALANQVGGADAAVIRGLANDDPVQKTAAQMHKLAADDDLSAEKITAALRGLRAEAQQRAERSLPPGDPKVSEEANRLADDYFNRLRGTYNSLVTGDEKKFDELVDNAGNEGDQSLNIALMQNHGKLSDLAELKLALKDDRKDMAAVQNILREKSAAQIRELSDAYKASTGKDLKYELFGNAAITGGEDEAIYDVYSGKTRKIGTGEELVKGKASGTDRLNLEDFMQRPDTEGGPQEVTYILERAEREYQYTLDHGGITGGIRDAFGNEERDLLDESIKEVRHLFTQYALLIGWMPFNDPSAAQVARPEMSHSGEAHGLIEKMRLARATIRGDRAAYEKATAALRAMLEMVAAFVLQAALSALLSPAAAALLEAVELGADAVEAGVMAARIAKFAANTTVNIASTVGANMAVYGEDYSVAMLKSDLLGGLGGSIGGEAVEKMLGPVAKGMATRLGPKASQEIIALAKTAGSMEGGAWAQGEAGDLTLQNLVKTHLMGKAAGAITETTGRVTGLAPKPSAPGGAPPEGHGVPTPSEPARTSEEPIGVPATAAAPKTSGAPATPEPLPSAAHGEEPAKAPARPATETPTTSGEIPGAHSPAADEPTLVDAKPIHDETTQVDAKPVHEEPTLVNWEPDVVHELPDGSAMWFTSPAETRATYNQSIRTDTGREVALYRNRRTGEVVMVQGTEGSVKVDLRVAREALPGPPGSWELEAHYHPIGDTGATPFPQRLPSSTNGDFSVLEWQAKRTGNRAQSSRIDYVVEGDKRGYTEFGYDPAAEKPYSINYPDPVNGERVEVAFKTREAYEEWYSDNFPGHQANIDAAPTGGGAMPAANAPSTEGGGGSQSNDPKRTVTHDEQAGPSPDEETAQTGAAPVPDETTGAHPVPDDEGAGIYDLPHDELLELAQLHEENIRLTQGEGVAPMPATGEEMAVSNAAVERARQILREPNPDPTQVREAINTLLERAVAEYRASFMLGGLEGGLNGKTRPLTSEALKDFCGGGRDITAEAIIALVGDSPLAITIERTQAEYLGFGAQHGFTILTLPGGTKFLIDPTFAQFMNEASASYVPELDPSHPSQEGKAPLYLENTPDARQAFTAGRMFETVEGSRLARDLAQNGFMQLSPGGEEARLYLIGLGAAPEAAPALAGQLLSGGATLLKETVQNGKVDERTLRPKDMDAIKRDAAAHGADPSLADYDEADLVATVTDPDAAIIAQHKAAQTAAPAGDPRLPLLESLITHLEAAQRALANAKMKK